MFRRFTSRQLGSSHPTPPMSATLNRATNTNDAGSPRTSGAYHFDSRTSTHLQSPRNNASQPTRSKPYSTNHYYYYYYFYYYYYYLLCCCAFLLCSGLPSFVWLKINVSHSILLLLLLLLILLLHNYSMQPPCGVVWVTVKLPVKPAIYDHPLVQQKVVFKCRRSCNTGYMYMYVCTIRAWNFGRKDQVVTLCRGRKLLILL